MNNVYINLKDIILPFISYETPLLQDFLKEFKEQTVSAGRKAYERYFCQHLSGGGRQRNE